jgi:hypothetical protein
MNKLVDPIKLLVNKIKSEAPHPEMALSASIVVDEVPYEIPFAPPAGAQVKRITIGSTYRVPIPVLFDMNSRTTYPLPDNG